MEEELRNILAGLNGSQAVGEGNDSGDQHAGQEARQKQQRCSLNQGAPGPAQNQGQGQDKH